MMQGYNSEDIAAGIDEIMIRQPLGVCAIIAPFNFPGDDPVLVPAVRDRLRQHRRRQAVRARAADDAEGASSCSTASKLPDGRRQPGERRPRSGRRDPRSSGHPRGQLRGIERRRAARLLARRPPPASACSARAAPRIRSSSCRTRTWRRRAEIIADSAFGCAGQRCLAAVARDHRRRRAASRSSSAIRRQGGERASPAMAWTRACRWGR